MSLRRRPKPDRGRLRSRLYVDGEGPTPKRPPSKPGERGWHGPGGGEQVQLPVPVEYRGTTVQVCGLWPFSVGAGAPRVGVPLGHGLQGQGTVCCDPISWFRHGIVLNPSMFVLGVPGLGKSSLVRRITVGSDGFGVIPLVLGDQRPDFVDLIRAMNGQVVSLGPGIGALNVLDGNEAHEASQRLTGSHRADVVNNSIKRRQLMVEALVAISRKNPPAEIESHLINRAVALLDERERPNAVLGDLLTLIKDGPEELRNLTMDTGDGHTYESESRGLRRSLNGLLEATELGAIFGQPTTEQLRRDRPAVFDLSHISDTSEDTHAAGLLACWSAGFSSVNIANALADAGVEAQRHYLVVMDELWRALGAARGLVDRINGLTRLNRREGVGQIMVSHSMDDLQSLDDEADRKKAIGFVERSAIKVMGGLPEREFEWLGQIVDLSERERQLVTAWNDGGNLTRAGKQEPSGRGRFLIKVGGRPGIAVKVELTEAELAVGDTSHRWREQSKIGALDE